MKIGFHTDAFNASYWKFEQCLEWAIRTCGDGVVDPDEWCDDMGESATCDDQCTPAQCGDGTLNTTSGEACDDGNLNAGDGCDGSCQVEP